MQLHSSASEAWAAAAAFSAAALGGGFVWAAAAAARRQSLEALRPAAWAVPAAAAVFLAALEGRLGAFFLAALLPSRRAAWAAAGGVCLEALVVVAAAVCGLLLGWARLVRRSASRVRAARERRAADPKAAFERAMMPPEARQHAEAPPQGAAGPRGDPRAALRAFARAAGEELGWRCFLAPALAAVMPPARAAWLGGALWAAFRTPGLLAALAPRRTPGLAADERLTAVLSHFGAATVQGARYAWLAARAGHCVWTTAAALWAWRRLCASVTGTAGGRAPGFVDGRRWLVSGEGVAGLLVGVPLAAAMLASTQADDAAVWVG